MYSENKKVKLMNLIEFMSRQLRHDLFTLSIRRILNIDVGKRIRSNNAIPILIVHQCDLKMGCDRSACSKNLGKFPAGKRRSGVDGARGGRGRFRRGPGGRRPRERRAAAADPRPRRPLAFLRALSRGAANPAGPRRSPPADSAPAAANSRAVCVAAYYLYLL